MGSVREQQASHLTREAGWLCASVLVMLATALGAGCRGKSPQSGRDAKTEARRSLEGFLQAVQHRQLEAAYDYLSRTQRDEVSFGEFAEGYQAGSIRLSAYEVTGVAEPEPDIKEKYKKYSPFLVPAGMLKLEAVKDDGVTPPGQKRIMEVPLSWILMVREGDCWRVQSKGWGPLHTVAFFGRPKAIDSGVPGRGGLAAIRYEDDVRRYEILLDGNWEDRSQHPSVVSTARDAKTHLIAFFKRSGSASLPNLTIQTYDVSGYPAIQSAMDYVDLARSSGRGTELRAPRPFMRDGATGVRWQYGYRLGAVTHHSVTDYYLDGRTMILVSSVSEPNGFDRDKEEITPMLDSFRLTTK